MSSKKVGKFMFKRVSLFFITFFVVLSAIALAALTTILSGETKPVADGTVEVSRGQKVHDFVDSRTTDGLNGLMSPGNFGVKGILGVFDPLIGTYIIKDRADVAYKTRLYVEGNTVVTDNLFVGGKTKTSKVFIYGGLQLSTMSNLEAYTACNTGAIGTIRLRMPTIITTETYCPLELCYPGNQSGHTPGVSRKSACDPVSFTSIPVRTGVGIGELEFNTN